MPFGFGSGGGVIFGVTGGVTEAVLRRLTNDHSKEAMHEIAECTSGSLDPSHVLMAIGLPHEIAHGSLRLTIDRENTEEQVDFILEKLPGLVQRLRDMSPVYPGKKA